MTVTEIGTRVLIIEDSDTKFRGVSGVVVSSIGDKCAITRASTINEAEAFVVEESWDLILLDISMDISATSAKSAGRGHANLGGLGVAYKMFLKRREYPTIIITAHDAFESITKKSVEPQIVDLKSIEAKAKAYLGDSFLGYIRYGDKEWASSLLELLERIER